MESNSPVTPLDPVAPWLGGKRKLAKVIVPLIESIPHETYCEVFFGMGAIFFSRTARPPSEVVNDRSTELHNFFWQLQEHYQQLMDEIRWKLTSRQQFEILSAQDPKTLTELQRAARFIYLLKTAFGGKATGQTFGVSPGRPARFDFEAISGYLPQVHHRLSKVVLENLDWAAVIERYDRSGTLFYLDPPYWDCEADYGAGMFSKTDFSRMAKMLADIDGRFILSINDVPQIRKIFEDFQILEVSTTYSVASGAPSRARELLISNGPLDAVQSSLLDL